MEAELIGSVLRGGALTIEELLSPVAAEDFYHPPHRALWRIILSLYLDHAAIDALTVIERARDRGDLDLFGGISGLTSLADLTATAANADYYAKRVLALSRRRQAIAVCSELLGEAFGEGVDGEIKDMTRWAHDASGRLAAIPDADQDTLPSMDDQGSKTLEYLKAKRAGLLTGVLTGFPDFDFKTGGLEPGRLTIIAGRPAMGKTAIVQNMIRHASKQGKRIYCAVYEGGYMDWTLRLWSQESRVPVQLIRSGKMSPHQLEDYVSAVAQQRHLPLHIDDEVAPYVSAVRARCRQVQRDHGQLDLVVVDYLQLMESDDKNLRNQNERVSSISKALKHLARDLKVHVIAISQLNRGVESRPDKRPLMSDLRESGQIEQDAHHIAFIYRDFYYHPDAPFADENAAELLLRKNREGSTGTIPLRFTPDTTRFDSQTSRKSSPPVQPASTLKHLANQCRPE